MAENMEGGSSFDNINALPDGILGHILSFLPTKVAVQTSVLSTRWRYVYTFASTLDFEVDWDSDDEGIGYEKADQLINCVDRVLSFPNGPSIVSFRLPCYEYVDPLRIDGWICALMCRNIQKLDLSNYDSDFEGPELPASLFSCETLVVLKLKISLGYPDLKVPARICLPNLKVLYMEYIGFPPNGCGERLLSSCPVLEDLLLRGCCFKDGCSRFNISNRNLKRLTLKSMVSNTRHEIVQVVINAPSLVYLNYSFSGCDSLVCADMQSLVGLETLVFQELPCGFGTGTRNLWEESFSFLLSSIRTIEIFSFNHKVEAHIDSVEFILNNGGLLEKLTVHILLLSSDQQLKLMNELLMLPRASKKCRVMIVWVS